MVGIGFCTQQNIDPSRANVLFLIPLDWVNYSLQQFLRLCYRMGNIKH